MLLREEKRYVEGPVTYWLMWFACKRKERETRKQGNERAGLLFRWCHGNRSLSAIILRVSEFTNSMTGASQMDFWWKPPWFHSIFSPKPPWRSGLNAGTFLRKTLSIMVGGGAYSATVDYQQRAEERNAIITNSTCTFRKKQIKN